MDDKVADIRIIEKPDTVSFEDIRKLLQEAHKSNQEKGLHYNTANQTAQELQQRLQNGGVCMVAMDGDRLVGTGSVDFRQIDRWYYQGLMGHLQMEGVLPEYAGNHIGTRLAEARIQYATERGVGAIYLTSAEKNHAVRNLYLHRGFVKVDYFAAPKDDFYSVVYVKWLSEKPHPDWYIKLRYTAKRLYIRLRYKPGRKARF